MSRDLKRISYVEDEPDIRAITELVLTTVGGFELDVSVDAVEATTRIPAYRPDMILLDVMMPGMNGEDLFHHLKTIPAMADIPVVFVTAKVQRHEVDDYHLIGAAGVIAKPFDPLTLSEKVRAIWEASRGPIAEAPPELLE